MHFKQKAVKIYKPARTATQSGRALTKKWMMKFIPVARPEADSLMGWVGSGDMHTQLKLFFDTQQQAIDYAEKHELQYEIIEPKQRSFKLKSYADNYRYNGA